MHPPVTRVAFVLCTLPLAGVSLAIPLETWPSEPALDRLVCFKQRVPPQEAVENAEIFHNGRGVEAQTPASPTDVFNHHEILRGLAAMDPPFERDSVYPSRPPILDQKASGPLVLRVSPFHLGHPRQPLEVVS